MTSEVLVGGFVTLRQSHTSCFLIFAFDSICCDNMVTLLKRSPTGQERRVNCSFLALMSSTFPDLCSYLGEL